MKSVGYAYATKDKSYLSKQIDALSKYHCDELVIETDNEESVAHPYVELEAAISEMASGDKLIIFELVCLGKSIIQLVEFMGRLNEKEIELVVVNKPDELGNIDNQVYTTFLAHMAKMEKEIIRARTSKGLEVARQNGRVGGRPRVSQDTVQKIQVLYSNNKYTLRQIAEECNISLGTAYKYTQAR